MTAPAPFAIPELARGVRLPADPANPLAEACLAPLLAARRALVGVTDPARQLALCDAPRLRRQVDDAIAALAAARAPDDPRRQRAEEAALEEGAGALVAALDRLATAAADLRRCLPPEGAGAAAAAPEAAAAWHRWVAALQGALRAAGEARADG